MAVVVRREVSEVESVRAYRFVAVSGSGNDHASSPRENEPGESCTS